MALQDDYTARGAIQKKAFDRLKFLQALAATEDEVLGRLDQIAPEGWGMVDVDFPPEPEREEVTLTLDKSLIAAFRKMNGDVDGRINRILETWLQMKLAGMLREEQAMAATIERLKARVLSEFAAEGIAEETPERDADPEHLDQDGPGVGAEPERPEDQPRTGEVDEVEGRPVGVDDPVGHGKIGPGDQNGAEDAKPVDQGEVGKHGKKVTTRGKRSTRRGQGP